MDKNRRVCEAQRNTPYREVATTKTLASIPVGEGMNVSSPSDPVSVGAVNHKIT